MKLICKSCGARMEYYGVMMQCQSCGNCMTKVYDGGDDLSASDIAEIGGMIKARWYRYDADNNPLFGYFGCYAEAKREHPNIDVPDMFRGEPIGLLSGVVYIGRRRCFDL